MTNDEQVLKEAVCALRGFHSLALTGNVRLPWRCEDCGLEPKDGCWHSHMCRYSRNAPAWMRNKIIPPPFRPL